MNNLKIALACDHAGFDTKEMLVAHLKAIGVETIKDFGAYSDESADYADFAHPMAEAVEKGEFQFGISICGSGNGINITANKHQGIRSALCWLPEIAKLAREHNDANVCSIPARFISPEVAKAIVDVFLGTGFEGGRHERRVNKIPLAAYKAM